MCNNDVGRAALGVSWNVVRIGYQHLQEAIPYAVRGRPKSLLQKSRTK